MKHLYISTLFISLFILIIGCDDNKDDIQYKFKLSYLGDITTAFNSSGGLRTLSISGYRQEIMQGDLLGEKEPIASSDFSIELQKKHFDIVKIERNKNEVLLTLSIGENIIPNNIEDTIIVSVKDGDQVYSETLPIAQTKANISYQYLISATTNPFILPSEGGSFEIPFTCLKSEITNGKEKEKLPSDLRGIQYEIYCINSAGIHQMYILKDGTEKGIYKFVIDAKGPYNMNYQSKWYVLFKVDDAEIFKQEFIQPQTPGEDYFIYPQTLAARRTFDI